MLKILSLSKFTESQINFVGRPYAEFFQENTFERLYLLYNTKYTEGEPFRAMMIDFSLIDTYEHHDSIENETKLLVIVTE
jgi:hypothetical protein